MTSLSVDVPINQINQQSNQLSVALTRLLSIVERLPQLNIGTFFQSLTTIEKDLEFARRLYYSAVREYNKAIEILSNSIRIFLSSTFRRANEQ